MVIPSWGDAVVVFTLAYGSVIRNTVDVEYTVLAFIIGKTLHYYLTNPSLRFFFVEPKYFQFITFIHSWRIPLLFRANAQGVILVQTRQTTYSTCSRHLKGKGHTNPTGVRVAVAVRAMASPSGAVPLALRLQRPVARQGTSRRLRNRGCGRACEHVDGRRGSRSSKALLDEDRTKRCLRGDDRGRHSHCHEGEIRHDNGIRGGGFWDVRGGVDDSRGVLKDSVYFEGSGGGAAHRNGGVWSSGDTIVCACESDAPNEDGSETERECNDPCDQDAFLAEQ